MKTQNPHKCWEWDFMYISPLDPEWDMCFCSDEKVQEALRFIEQVDKDIEIIDEEKVQYSPLMERFRESGLMGCFDGTGINSENYKDILEDDF